MTTLLDAYHRSQALRRAVGSAVRAPSVHNTQPWKFQLNGDRLDLRADLARQLRVLDPTRRQLTISCGCALFNARASLAASGLGIQVDRLPDADQPDLLARITATGGPADDPIAELAPAISYRQTNRRRYDGQAVPDELLDRLVVAANAEDARLHVIRTAEDRAVVAALSQQADAVENLNPAYRAEIRAWTTDDPQRRDGVAARTVPHVDGTSGDDVPIRDFDTRGLGWLPSQTRSSREQCLLLMGTDADNPLSWLRAGEALERILLEITRAGLVAEPLTQVIEVPQTRARLREQLRLTMRPDILLRVGYAPVTPASSRRDVAEVLVDQREPDD